MTAPKALDKQGLMSSGEVATEMGVHRTTVWHWIKSGRLKMTRVTPRFSGVSREALNAFKADFVGAASDDAVSPKKAPSSKKNGHRAKAKKPRKR